MSVPEYYTPPIMAVLKMNALIVLFMIKPFYRSQQI